MPEVPPDRVTPTRQGTNAVPGGTGFADPLGCVVRFVEGLATQRTNIMGRRYSGSLAFALALLVAGCSQPAARVLELKHFPIDSIDGIITRSQVTFDRHISSDGNGSLRIDAQEPMTVRLFETGNLDVENARILYRAKVRTKDVEGQVYLEMWCHFPGKGEFFSRALHTPLTGTTEWTTQETPFFLNKGENPDNIRLNLVVDGRGTAWIDDIRLMQGPLL